LKIKKKSGRQLSLTQKITITLSKGIENQRVREGERKTMSGSEVNERKTFTHW
jgi:hypothetical protein